MARGFGTALYGSNNGDEIRTTFTAHNAQRSWGMWVFRNGDGGAGTGRIWGKVQSNGDGITEILYFGSGLYIFERWCSTADGMWYIAAPATGAWHHILVTYDSSSMSNDPIFYLDGVVEGSAEANAPAGTANTDANPFIIGNIIYAVAWDGMLAEFAIWDAILTAEEALAVGGRRASPLLVRPQSLVEYVPMVRDNVSYKRDAGAIIETPLVQPHPPIIYPQWIPMGRRITAVAAAGGPPPPFLPRLNTLVRM